VPDLYLRFKRIEHAIGSPPVVVEATLRVQSTLDVLMPVTAHLVAHLLDEGNHAMCARRTEMNSAQFQAEQKMLQRHLAHARSPQEPCSKSRRSMMPIFRVTQIPQKAQVRVD
jgi:hypothetical protein